MWDLAIIAHQGGLATQDYVCNTEGCNVIDLKMEALGIDGFLLEKAGREVWGLEGT